MEAPTNDHTNSFSMSDGTSSINELSSSAKSLIQRALASYDPEYGFSTTSVQVYETAWVSMVSKAFNGVQKWVFPESFHYLLKTQSDDGSWGLHPDTQTVGILETASALLALIRHHRKPLQICDISSVDLQRRIDKAIESLRAQLDTWHDVQTSNHIGEELIVPALLEYLQHEDSSFTFEFDAKDVLLNMREAKLAKFKPEYLYGPKALSVLHSLEAFVGKIDFDKVSHHVCQGSMLASPASTAAYLIEASRWDDAAEGYLRHVSRVGSGHGDGGFPGIFPTTNFEFAWVLTTLLRVGIPLEDPDCSEIHNITEILIQAFENDGGVIGCAPRAVDADDTAKGLLALSMLNRSEAVSPDPMIQMFEVHNYFSTFGSERDPSFTTNCHVLLALLHQDDVGRYASQIRKTVEFLCSWWWSCDGKLKDKWHLSHLYPTVLMAEAFTDVLQLLDEGALPDVLTVDTQLRMAISLFQACARTLQTQGSDGSWDGEREHTSYGMLVLAEARNLSLFSGLQAQLESALQRGVHFLKNFGFQPSENNWTSKTAYRATFVAEAYSIAALWVGSHPMDATTYNIGSSLPIGSIKQNTKEFTKILRRTPLFADIPEWRVLTSVTESSLFIPLLEEQRLSIFAGDPSVLKGGSYINFIPLTWVGTSNRSGTFVSTAFMYDMMLMSVYGYQIDEYIETVAGSAFDGDVHALHKLIDRALNSFDNDSSPTDATGDEDSKDSRDSTQRKDSILDAPAAQATPAQQAAATQLSTFATYVLHHPAVRTASRWDQQHLHRELRAFLHAQASHFSVNAEYARCGLAARTSPSFLAWVRGVAADSVGCAHSFAFASCLLSSALRGGAELFPRLQEKYIAGALIRGLSTICRIYNDYGSLARDSAAGNVNSMHFPEFASADAKKDALDAIGRFERGCVAHALEELERESCKGDGGQGTGGRKMEYVRYFVDMTDLYDQLYVLRDWTAGTE